MVKTGRLRAKFWGVRGSIPTPGTETAKYGGNTSCIEVQGGEEMILMDAGTGIRQLGLDLINTGKPCRVHILLSHTHWDHIQGFPFFMPIYAPGNEIYVYGPRALEKSLEDAVMFQLQYSYFPVRGVELQAKLEFRELDEETFNIGDIEISTRSMNHPIRVLAYKFRKGSRTGLYTGDNEPYYDVLAGREDMADFGIHRQSEFIKECNNRVIDFIRGTDTLIADTQYTDEEYESKRGWGHSSIGAVLDIVKTAGVKKLVLFHHDPLHTDPIMDEITEDTIKRAAKTNKKLKVVTAQEGESVAI
jgi:phosphoribosyl 1,2-cyclic phosphodiesterase